MTKLDDGEMAYLRWLAEQIKQLEQSRQLFEAFLATRYHLRPGDRIDDDGAIERRGGPTEEGP